FNGAIGMTFEQGGAGRAGLGIQTKIGDTLTLWDRIIHHYTAGMSTIEMDHRHRERLLDEFSHYFSEHAANPRGQYRTFVLQAGDAPARLLPIKTLLDRNGIQYGYADARSGLKGYAYSSGMQESFSL